MTKLLGSALILAGGAVLWGSRMAERRRSRETLRELMAALARMEEEIRMARVSLPILLERLAGDCETPAGVFFHRGAAAMMRGNAWEPETELLPVSTETGRTLRELGKNLRGDEENICKAISLAKNELAREWTLREERRQEEEKRLAALCFSASALLVILLI